jgi:Mn-dependent DtxR family transcriptional regulator
VAEQVYERHTLLTRFLTRGVDGDRSAGRCRIDHVIIQIILKSFGST